MCNYRDMHVSSIPSSIVLSSIRDLCKQGFFQLVHSCVTSTSSDVFLYWPGVYLIYFVKNSFKMSVKVRIVSGGNSVSFHFHLFNKNHNNYFM